ncbi:MAG: carboxypeptidase regulatory-like domain-containing protein [Candidatus Riflebacteria bacterium]|nr:carboxypeptidase regulatory-like domain-containing protein [Candidatus Riflebacteria bacterium]
MSTPIPLHQPPHGPRPSFQARLHREIARVLRGPEDRRRAPSPVDGPPRRPWASLFLVAGLALLIGVWGCENEQKTPRGVVSGWVLDTQGNRVIGAKVTSHRSLYEAVTGKDGRYAFTSLDAGSHRLLVQRDGYQPASRTISLDFGQVDQAVDFTLEPLPNRLAWSVFSRAPTAVVIDATSVEPMRCVAVYQGEHLPALRTPPSDPGLEHRFTLSPLRPDTVYHLQIEGETPDGRRYLSASSTFRPTPTGDEPGPPPAPDPVILSQTHEGPRLAWGYPGTDPLAGFRIWRGTGDSPLTLWRDETLVAGIERFVVDGYASPGVRLRFALEAVDLDGNVSSRTSEVVLYPAGELTADVTWKAAWSPIDLAGDIWVPAGVTFTVEPGVTVRVAASDASQLGYDPNACEIVADGRLLIGASASLPVRFISASAQPTRTDWQGIRVRTPQGVTGSVLAGLAVNNARAGLLVSDTALTVSAFEARSCETGLLIQGASGTRLAGLSCVDCGTALAADGTIGCRVGDLTVRGGATGVALRGNRLFTLAGFDIRDVLGTGLQLEDTASTTVRGGVVAADRLGMSIKAGSSTVEFVTVDAPAGVLVDGGNRPDLRNCILVNREAPGTGYGLEERTAGRSYPWNNIFGFLSPTKNCSQSGAPILNTDPRFVGGGSADYDYHLREGSPLLGAADDGGQMGAYGWAGD